MCTLMLVSVQSTQQMKEKYSSLNTDQLYEVLKQELRPAVPESVVPDFELRYKAELIIEIEKLKKEKNAVILGHNYMEPVLFHTVPDYRGDSLELARRAAQTDADIIVFCGVHFMAETAKILNPSKKVLIPSLEAGCSLAEGITPQDILQLKSLYPHLPVITYINSSAAVKAVSDVCATSGNVEKVVRWAQEYFHTPSVIFLPDKYMAQNVASSLGLATYFPTPGQDLKSEAELLNTPTLVGWNARCYVHEQYSPEFVKDIRNTYPDAVILAHPECPPDTVKAADFSGSTSSMVNFVRQHASERPIALLTECSMADNIVASYPEVDQNLIRMCSLRCKHMHTITLEQTLSALREEKHEIHIPDSVRQQAETAVRRMIAIG